MTLRTTASCSSQRTATAAALPSRASVTMVGHGDCRVVELSVVVPQQIAQMAPRRRWGFAAQREPQHLVEVAVVQIAPPIDRNEAPAHDAVEILRPIGVAQQPHVGGKLPFRNQHAAKTLNGHIGECEEPVENHAEAFSQYPPVIAFQIALGRRQVRAQWVIDQIQHEAAVVSTVTELVQTLQSIDASLE